MKLALPQTALTTTSILLIQSLSAESAWTKHVIQPPVQGKIHSAVAHDWDADGHLDVLSSFDGEVVLLKGPTWAPHAIHRFSPGLARSKPRPACIHTCLMDVDGDGDQDFIGSNNTVFWLECPDQPFSGQAWTYRTVDDEILGSHCVLPGDVNRDGKLDLIANSSRDATRTPYPESLAWLEVPKDPHTAESWVRHIFADRDAPGGSHYTGFGDVNGDGRPDISCAAKGGEKFPEGNWFAWWQQPEDPTQVWTKHLLAADQLGATNILPADLNNDGVVDYFATRGHGFGVLWFKGPDFELIEVDPTLPSPHSLDLVDMDQDGDIDAITCGKEADGIVALYLNDGQGNFSKRTLDENQGSYDTRAIDMDGDGDFDILIAGQASKNIVWYENPLR